MQEESKEIVSYAKKEFDGVEVVDNERYGYLLDDLKSIWVERIKNLNEEKMRGMWEIGERINKEFVEAGYKEYTKLLSKISADMELYHFSQSELYRAVEFHRKFPIFEEVYNLEEGQNISWNKIRDFYLPQIPIQRIPRTLPILEFQDKWHMIEWWLKNPEMNFTMVIADKEHPELRLVVRPESIKRDTVPIMQILKDLGYFYISIKKYNSDDLDSQFWGDFNKAAKNMLIRAKGDVGKVKSAIQWAANKFTPIGLDWNYNTVLKHWPDAIRTAAPYEHYIKRER